MSLRLLVIDDDPVDRLAIRRAIEQGTLHAEIEEVGGADTALVALANGRYDCLLLDHDPAGRELMKKLRADGNYVPIVVLTGNDAEELLEEAVELGVTDFIPKRDLTPGRLGQRVKFAIRIGRAEAESARAKERAEEAARAREAILAVVSHDLRGPLHAISLATEALHDEITGASIRYLGSIERASLRAERLISDLLEASAIENGALTLARAPVDAGGIIRQAAADHELVVKESGAQIVATVPDEQLVVSADRDRVLQVLGNLIGNSLKHARGAPIGLSVARRDTAALIAVKDEGPGIAPNELPHIFDRYWSGHPKRGGAGLGLAIAKGIVSAHGGSLAVDSTQGSGVTFSFMLPLVTA
jgi:signal transduction histidine kinase